MKNILLCLLLILFSAQSGQAQSIVEDGNRWIVGWFQHTQGTPGAFLTFERLYEIPIFNADTIVANLNYKKLFRDEEYYGLLRESSDSTIYFVPKESLTEFVLYKFSAEVGDTINVYAGGTYDMIVDTIIPGRVFITDIYDGMYCEWYYALGGLGGLLETDCQLVVGTGYNALTCMSDTNYIRYGAQGDSSQCEKTLVGISNIKEKKSILAIYPNPSQSFVTISLKNNNTTMLIILNALGQIIQELEITNTITLDVSSWESGIYFIKCQGAIQKIVLN